MVTFTLAPRFADAQPSRDIDKSVNPDDVGAFLAIDAKGMVTLYSGKVELGTGALTAITQIAAEELSVPFGRVTTIQGDTALTPNQGPTYASLSIQDGGMQIRRAAATARDALLDAGGTQARCSRRPSSSFATASSVSATAASPCRTPSSSAIGSSPSR